MPASEHPGKVPLLWMGTIGGANTAWRLGRLQRPLQGGSWLQISTGCDSVFQDANAQGWVQRVLRQTPECLQQRREFAQLSFSCLEFPGGLSQLWRATSSSHTRFMRSGFQNMGIKGMGCLPLLGQLLRFMPHRMCQSLRLASWHCRPASLSAPLCVVLAPFQKWSGEPAYDASCMLFSLQGLLPWELNLYIFSGLTQTLPSAG